MLRPWRLPRKYRRHIAAEAVTVLYVSSAATRTDLSSRLVLVLAGAVLGQLVHQHRLRRVALRSSRPVPADRCSITETVDRVASAAGIGTVTVRWTDNDDEPACIYRSEPPVLVLGDEDTEDRNVLAAVVAHELGHLQVRWPNVKRVCFELVLAVCGTLLWATRSPLVIQIAAAALSAGAVFAWRQHRCRAEEFAADRFAAQLLTPAHMVYALVSGSLQPSSWFSTHPSTMARVEALVSLDPELAALNVAAHIEALDACAVSADQDQVPAA